MRTKKDSSDLGSGKVLRCRHRLEELGHKHVLAVLVPEREPRDPSWRKVCAAVGVIMLSRGELDRAPKIGLYATKRGRRLLIRGGIRVGHSIPQCRSSRSR
jgi:hypothetical protein